MEHWAHFLILYYPIPPLPPPHAASSCSSALLQCTLPVEAGDAADALWWLTPKARAVVRWVLKRPTPTLCWTMWMGVLYFCLDVGVGKITVIALSWLNEKCATLQPAMVLSRSLPLSLSHTLGCRR